MKAITVRGIEPDLAKRLKAAAQAKGKSVNQFVIDQLKQGLGMQKEKKFTVVHHDLDHLFGKWSQEEYSRIQGKIDKERTIDKELWNEAVAD